MGAALQEAIMGFEDRELAADTAPDVHVEVSPIVGRELTVHVAGEALRLRFDDFPWFRQAGADRLCWVEWHAPDHLFWPRLDVKLSVHFIRLLAAAPRHAR